MVVLEARAATAACSCGAVETGTIVCAALSGADVPVMLSQVQGGDLELGHAALRLLERASG